MTRDALKEFEQFSKQLVCSTANEHEIMGQATRLWVEIVRLRAEVSLMTQERALQNAYIGMLESRNSELEKECIALKARLGEAGNA